MPWAYRTWRIVRGMNQPLGASSMRFAMSGKNADSLAQLGCATPHQACEALKYCVLQVGGQEETAHVFDLASICNCFNDFQTQGTLVQNTVFGNYTF